MSTYSSTHGFTRTFWRRAALLFGGTACSRVLGFIRDCLFARYLGTGFEADAFFVGFRLPNLLRQVLGEGGVDAAVVPVFSRVHRSAGAKELGRVFCSLTIWGTGVLLLVCALGIIAADVWVAVVAPGFLARPEDFGRAVTLARIMFPYLIFIGLAAQAAAWMKVQGRYKEVAFSPMMLNIVLIPAIPLAYRLFPDPVLALAVFVVIAGLAQWAVYWPALKKAASSNVVCVVHPAVKRIGRLLGPRLLSAGVHQLNILIDTMCASFASVVGMGGIAALYYATRLVQLPMGLLAVSFVSVMLPSLSQRNVGTKQENIMFYKEIEAVWRWLILIILPVSGLLVVTARPLVRFLFERGEFDAYSTLITSTALMCYALGLAFMVTVKVFQNGFYAVQDTRTPLVLSFVALITNGVLNVVLMFPLRLAGIALASSLAAGLHAVLLGRSLIRRIDHEGRRRLRSFFVKVTVASIGMTEGVYLFWGMTDGCSEGLRLLATGPLAVLLYAALIRGLNIEEAASLVQRFLRGKAGSGRESLG